MPRAALRNTVRPAVVEVARMQCEAASIYGSPCRDCVEKAAVLVCTFLQRLPGGAFDLKDVADEVRIETADA
jgi:hypothetical protein